MPEVDEWPCITLQTGSTVTVTQAAQPVSGFSLSNKCLVARGASYHFVVLHLSSGSRPLCNTVFEYQAENNCWKFTRRVHVLIYNYALMIVFNFCTGSIF